MTDEDYKNYLNIRTDAESLIEKSSKILDSRTYTTATGVLGLSVAILTYIGDDVICICLLYASWTLIAISLLLDTYSHISSKSKAHKVITSIDNMICNNESYEHNKICEILQKYNADTRLLNWGIFATLWSGIIVMIIFIVNN